MAKPVVLITGVGKRIGYALAKHFINQQYQVVGTYRTHYASINELSELGADLYHCDFYDQNSVNRLIAELSEKYTALRAIIHNASDWLADNSTISRAEIIKRMMDVHVSVPYQINLSVGNRLYYRNNHPADIIHITDYVAEKGSKKHIAYAASKAAMENMTQSFAALMAPGVKVNAIAPSLILFNEGDGDSYKQTALNKSLMGMEAGLEEIIHAVDYLFSSRYVTGRTLAVDGGRHLK